MAGLFRPPPFGVPPGAFVPPPYAMPGQPFPFSPAHPGFPQPHMASPPHYIPIPQPMPGYPPPPPYAQAAFPPMFGHPHAAPHFFPQHHRGPSFTIPIPMQPPPPPAHPYPLFETHWSTGTPPPLYVPFAPSAFPMPAPQNYMHASGIPMNGYTPMPRTAPPIYTVPPQQTRPNTARYETPHAMPHPQTANTPGRRHMRTKSGTTFAFETGRRVHNVASRADADRREIPSNYRIDEWDPDEEPILLFGNAWDIQSIGKYIFDWACYQFGPGSPRADVAADLWIQAIRLAAFISRASHAAKSSVLSPSERVALIRYTEEGQRIWMDLKTLFKACERVSRIPIGDNALPRNGSLRDLENEHVRQVVDFVRHLLEHDRRHAVTEDILTSIHNFNAKIKDRDVEKVINKVLRPSQR